MSCVCRNWENATHSQRRYRKYKISPKYKIGNEMQGIKGCSRKIFVIGKIRAEAHFFCHFARKKSISNVQKLRNYIILSEAVDGKLIHTVYGGSALKEKKLHVRK